MSFIGNMFSGEMGAGFRAQQGATTQQAQELYRQQQQRLQQQQAFTQALMAQSPQAIAAQQQALGQLQQQAQGMGPSVASRQLASTTGQNIAQTGALMGAQRGASQDPGAMAERVARMGAATQQQAAGQAATLRAQEQIAARQAASQLAGQQLGQISGAQQVGMTGTAQAQQNVLDAINRQNAVNAAIAAGNQQFQTGLIGGALGAAGAAAGMPMAEGGEVKEDKEDDRTAAEKFFETFGASMEKPDASANYQAGMKAGKGVGQAIGKGLGKLFKTEPTATGTTKGGYAGANLGVDQTLQAPTNPLTSSSAIGAYKLPFAEGGKVDAMLSPGEKYLNPSEVKQVSQGDKDVMSAGKMIPGKAKVKGDSLKNDIVPAKLQEGGIVIPRSVMQSKDPAEQARKFVAAIVAKQHSKRK